jgi:microsomal dipeptidase-like Zn-dependent dipeptidase
LGSHIERMIDAVGADHVGVGTDMAVRRRALLIRLA